MQILKNPGFDEGIPNDWRPVASGSKHRFIYPEEGKSERVSVAIEYPVRDEGKRAYWGQDIQIDHTKRYKLSGWIKFQNVVSDIGGVHIQIDWKDINGNYLSNSNITEYYRGTSSWTYIERDVIPNQNASMATILLILSDCSGKAWFDDMSFSDIVPEVGHPNIYLNQNETNIIKSRINVDPWKTAYNNFMPEANAALTILRDKMPNVVEQGPTPPNGDRHDYWNKDDPKRLDYTAVRSLDKNVRALGLAYAITGDQKYANKAIEFIEVWCIDSATKMNPRIYYAENYYMSQIQLATTLPGMYYGADLIWNYSGWKSSSRDAFKSWVMQITNQVKNEIWGCRPACQNFENWRLVLASSGSALIGDNTGLQNIFNRWKVLIPLQMDSQGRMIEERKRGEGSLSYSLYAINAMIQVAEIARHHNVDLYNYKVSSTDKRGLELALDYHAPYCAHPENAKPPEWPVTQVYDGANAALFELAYTFKKKSSYMDAINKWRRPMYENRTMGPVTLTHGS